MRKRTWFKSAGVVAFAAQLLGGAGLAGAVDNAKTCVPTPSFVYGGDPVYTSLTADNLARWSGSAGYGWNEGSGAEISYETALAKNFDSNAGVGEIGTKSLLLSFMSNRAMPLVDGVNGMRIGFDYSFTDPIAGKEDVSQILVLNFDDGSPTSSWSANPPDCPSSAVSNCANNPSADPLTWTSFKPASASLLKKINDGNSTGWTNGGTSWVTDHTRVWIFADHSVTPTKYWWRVNMSLPIRTTLNDPSASWTSPSVYFDPNSFVATSGSTVKFVPHFWTEMLTDATDKLPDGSTPKVIHHFPDWTSDMTHPEPTRDSNNIPTKTAWGQAEIGSPRDPALLNGELACAGQGLLIEGTTGDNVLWHSAIWNNKGNPNNTASLFDPAGTLYMFDKTNNVQAHNNMSVMVKNEGGAAVKPSDVHATFLVAPYGSQAANTVWSALNAGDASTKGGNDFTCIGGGTTGNTSCSALPKVFPPIDSKPHDPTLASLTTGNDAQWDMAQDWIPAPNYVCAVQTSDAPGSLTWWYQEPHYRDAGHLCEKAVYTPNDITGMVNNGANAGLPGHQCMQVQLSGNGVQFAIKSAFRNMHQAPASLYRETATIDTRGLAKVAGRSYHNVYLYVETHNMPYRVDGGYAPTTYPTAVSAYTTINRYCFGGGEVGIKANAREGFDCRGYDPNVPVPSEEFFTKVMPTLVVHAYADTGVTQTIHGKKVPVLTPMTSFGQYITHDSTSEGNVFGWNAGLEPFNGTAFQKVGVDTYRIQIPNDGVGHVVTHVEPLPTRRPTCSGTVNMDILSLLKAIAPLIVVDPVSANEINGLIDSLKIECVDLHELLTKIDGLKWGLWQSWVHYLISQIEATDGCHCK